MNGNQKPFFRSVLRHQETGIGGSFNIRSVSSDQQKSFRVVSSAVADRVHKCLVNPVRQLVALAVRHDMRQRVFTVQRRVFIEPGTKFLVCTLKNQPPVILPEPFRQLLPHPGVCVHGQVSNRFGIRTEHSPPSAVPVIVDDHNHTGVQGIVHNFLHPVQIRRGNRVISPVQMRCVCHPGHRDPDRIKAAFLHGLKHLPRCDRLPPECFIIGWIILNKPAVFPVAAGFHGVSEIDAVPHAPAHDNRVFRHFLRRSGTAEQ